MRASQWVAASLTALLAACTAVQTTQPGAVGVERKQFMVVPEAEIQQASAQAYTQELAKAKQAGVLNKDQQQLQRVRAIAQRLIPQTSVFRSDAVQWDWDVNVQSTKDVNAYCMPGGKIMVYTGLIDSLQATDAELAAVIGHEMAHALREHTRERVSRAYAEQIALAGVAAATGAGQGVMQLASTVSAVTFQLPHSREQESEADRIGLELMARAGFEPNAAVTLWQKMQKTGGSGGPEFLSTHPASGSRIEQLQADIPRVLPLYEAAKNRSASR
jgi:predicted Zn-dependent protease